MPIRILIKIILGLTLIAGSLVATTAPAGAAGTDPLCPAVDWPGATAAGPDRAYHVAAPPGPFDGAPDWSPNGTTICYLATRTINVTDLEPIYFFAGYQLDDRSGDPGVKSLVYATIQCFSGDTEVFGINVLQNLWTGVGQSGFYPRAIFTPPAAGRYQCGLRIANQYMGQPPKPVYVVSGYLSTDPVPNVSAQVGAVTPDGADPDYPGGKGYLYIPRGTNAEVRRVQLNVPPGVSTLRASSIVNFTECSWTDDNAGRCPEGSYSQFGGGRFKIRIVAWQTVPGTTKVCRYLAPPNTDVPWGHVVQDRHHLGIKVDADLNLSSDPACGRTVVAKTYLELDSSTQYDAGFVYSKGTVLSVFAR